MARSERSENCTRLVRFAQHLHSPIPSGLPVPVPRCPVSLSDAGPLALYRTLLQLFAARRVEMAAVVGRLVLRALRRSTLVRSVFGHATVLSQEMNPHWHTPCDFSTALT